MSNKKTEIRSQKRKNKLHKLPIAVISLLIVLLCGIGGTYAFLADETKLLVNTFETSDITIDIEENFDGTNKSDINVEVTGDTEAYVRVNLVTYRVNDRNEPIGGSATIPAFTLGKGWEQIGDYYYYLYPVKPGSKPAQALNQDAIELKQYEDADGGKQVIDVMAEAIQSQPWEAVQEAWGKAVADKLKTAVGTN